MKRVMKETLGFICALLGCAAFLAIIAIAFRNIHGNLDMYRDGVIIDDIIAVLSLYSCICFLTTYIAWRAGFDDFTEASMLGAFFIIVFIIGALGCGIFFGVEQMENMPEFTLIFICLISFVMIVPVFMAIFFLLNPYILALMISCYALRYAFGKIKTRTTVP